jgi:hypothetical protein
MEVRVLSWSRIKQKSRKRKESLLSIFFFWISVFQSGALEERRSSPQEKKVYFQFSFSGFLFVKGELWKGAAVMKRKFTFNFLYLVSSF